MGVAIMSSHSFYLIRKRQFKNLTDDSFGIISNVIEAKSTPEKPTKTDLFQIAQHLSALALSWKTCGKNKGKGYEGFVVGKQGTNIELLGCNQSDQVKLSAFKASLIVAYVMPSDFNNPDKNLPELNKRMESESFAGTR
jgi:hypothetical protein